MRTQNPPLSVKECAKILRRSVQGVQRKLHDLRIVVQPHTSTEETKRQIMKLQSQRRHDGYIAIILKKSKRTIRTYRQELKRKAVRSPGWAQGIDKRRNHSGRPRCLNCNALCPLITRTNNWEELTGWKRRLLALPDCYEIYCKECFDRWGWCDDPRRKTYRPYTKGD